MSKKIIILGGKMMNTDIKEKLSLFDNICRVNLNLKYKDKTDKDIFYVNNHIYDFIVKRRIKPIELKQYPYDFIPLEVLANFHNMLNNNEYGKILMQYESGKCNESNKILEAISCPYRFIKAPRCGYQAILYFLVNGYDVSICGFSLENKKIKSYYHNNSKVPSIHHDYNSELKILKWLSDNKYVDASLCLLE